MNEFQWLRQTRALNQTHTPERDLWPNIAAQLEPVGRRHASWLPWTGAAAVIFVGLLLGAIALHAPLTPVGPQVATRAGAHWKPHDPRLAGAAIEFSAARDELRLAMQQTPDAAFLQRILQRTRAQEHRLQRYSQHTL